MPEIKLKAPHIIEATYRIVTPMFIGDAEQKASGISPTSVKGALRFWWRALNWGRIRTNEKFNTDESALRELHAQESALFGSSAENGNAAAFTLRVTSESKPTALPNPQPGIQYLLGQGLYHFRDGYLRPALAADASVRVALLVKPKPTKQNQADYDEQNEQLAQALLALGVLGGLGSRARKGFGSLSIETLNIGKKASAIPQNIQELKKIIEKWQHTIELPPFTSLSKKARIDISVQGIKALEVLNKVGEEQQLYRSYGRADRSGIHKVNGKEAEQNFANDHDLVADIIRHKTTPTSIPVRSVFGLPHNYFFSTTGGKADFAPITKDMARRASPLFIHVHQFPNKQVAVIQSLLPAKFLPDRTTLEFKIGNRPSDKVNVSFDEKTMTNWQVIHTYMDRFVEKVSIL